MQMSKAPIWAIAGTVMLVVSCSANTNAEERSNEHEDTSTDAGISGDSTDASGTNWQDSGDDSPADAPSTAFEDADGDPKIDTARTQRKFVSFTLTEGWGPCSSDDCWTEIGVEAPGVLVLEDSHGEELFDLNEEEYDSVLDIIFGSEILGILSEPVKWACPPVTDVSTVFAITWTDTGTDTVLMGGCKIRDEYREHSFNVLAELMDELVANYLSCEPYTIPRGWIAGLDPSPTGPLCARCGEPCGATYTYE